TVAPTEGTSVATNGMPTMPVVTSAAMVGTGQALIGMSSDAVVPHAAVTFAWMVPVAVGVPLMMLPLSVRPAGRPVTERVAPGESASVDRNGRPTVPETTPAETVGVAQGSMVMVTGALVPHAFCATTVTLPLTVGMPEVMLPASVSPAGRGDRCEIRAPPRAGSGGGD